MKFQREFRRTEGTLDRAFLIYLRNRRVRSTVELWGSDLSEVFHLQQIFLHASIQSEAISRRAVFQIQLPGAYELVEFPLKPLVQHRTPYEMSRFV